MIAKEIVSSPTSSNITSVNKSPNISAVKIRRPGTSLGKNTFNTTVKYVILKQEESAK